MTTENWLAIKDYINCEISTLNLSAGSTMWDFKSEILRNIQQKMIDIETDCAIKSLIEAGY